MSEKKRVTLSDVAEAAGVGRGTVSRALRGEALVSATTRAKVRATAEALGYEVNAAARALAEQRTDGKGGQIEILYLCFMETHSITFSEICREMGLKGTIMTVDMASDPQRLSEQLYNQGVDGILLNPKGHEVNDAWLRAFDWARFPVLMLGRKSGLKGLDLIRHSANDYMSDALKGLKTEGYQKIQVMLHTSVSPEDDEARLGAVLGFQKVNAKKNVKVRYVKLKRRVEDFEIQKLARAVEDDWHDVLLFDCLYLLDLLHQHGMAHLLEGQPYAAARTADTQDEAYGHVSGCPQNTRLMYQRALQAIYNKVKAGNKGASGDLIEQVVKPEWKARETTGFPRRKGKG